MISGVEVSLEGTPRLGSEGEVDVIFGQGNWPRDLEVDFSDGELKVLDGPPSRPK